MLFGRPAVAAAMSLGWLVLLILLSRFKHDVLLMTVNFVDLMIIDQGHVLVPDQGVSRSRVQDHASRSRSRSLRSFSSGISTRCGCGAAPRRSAPHPASRGWSRSALSFPNDPWEEFYSENYFSKFTRSGVTAIGDLIVRGVLESGCDGVGRLAPAQRARPRSRRTSSWCSTSRASTSARSPGVKVPAGYGAHFKSFDGKQRKFMVEGAGGPSWYTEYNVLTGLSARSYGRFADFVTRIAAGRVSAGCRRRCADAATRRSRSIRCTARS